MSEKPSAIVQENIDALIERERAGRIEHGDDMDRQDLPVMRWLEELRCESLDSANYAVKLMHLLPKLLAAVAVLERIGFTWADGEWKSGAAQEAVAWQVGDDFYTSESLAIEGIQQWGPSGSIAIPLYAAPVAAAPVVPVDSDAFSYLVDEVAAEHGEMLDDGGPSGWAFTCEDLVAFAKRLMSDYKGVLVADAYAIARAEAKRDSTPAAPGIDLEQFRPAVCAMGLYAEEPGDVDEAKRLLALIDASPKGGSDARDAALKVSDAG